MRSAAHRRPVWAAALVLGVSTTVQAKSATSSYTTTSTRSATVQIGSHKDFSHSKRTADGLAWPATNLAGALFVMTSAQFAAASTNLLT